MKSIIAAIITCGILFGVSYGASNYFASVESTVDEETEPIEETADQKSTLPPDVDAIKKVPVMQVGPGQEASISLEAVMQMSDSIKKMEEKLILREQRLNKEEQRIKLLFSDIEMEQNELQAFSEGVDAKVEAMERMTDAMREVLQALEIRKAELAKLEKEQGTDEFAKQTETMDRVNDSKSWFAGLEAQQASEYLKEIANQGDLEFAALMLHKMDDRQKAKILGAMGGDASLVKQLIDALPKQARKAKK